MVAPPFVGRACGAPAVGSMYKYMNEAPLGGAGY